MGDSRIYVGGLDERLTEDDVRAEFGASLPLRCLLDAHYIAAPGASSINLDCIL